MILRRSRGRGRNPSPGTYRQETRDPRLEEIPHEPLVHLQEMGFDRLA